VLIAGIKASKQAIKLLETCVYIIKDGSFYGFRGRGVYVNSTAEFDVRVSVYRNRGRDRCVY
jgi:hypothetical protein